MSFLIKDNQLLEKYNGIWDKVDNVIKKKKFWQWAYIQWQHLKAIIKSYKGKVDTNAKKGFHCFYLSVVLVDFVFEMGESYHHQVLLK